MQDAPRAPGNQGQPAWVATAGLTAVAMVAFAANSLLARLALRETTIDAASYTAIRLVSGAVVLWLLGGGPRSAPRAHGNWISAIALFVYAIAFSFAYRQLTAATGALLLFGAVQTTMLGRAWFQGERFTLPQACGLFLALAGFVGLVLPGLSAPPLSGSVLMVAAGAAWGVYSLRGLGVTDPLRATGGNFLRAAPIALVVTLLTLSLHSGDREGVLLAVSSGALASLTILGGIALVILRRGSRKPA